MIGGPRKRAEQNLAYSPRVASGEREVGKDATLRVALARQLAQTVAAGIATIATLQSTKRDEAFPSA